MTLFVSHADSSSPSDLADLSELRWQWRIVEAGGTGMPRAEFDAEFGDWVRSHARSNLPFLARFDGVAVGMAWLALIDRIPGPDRWLRRAGLVQSVFVRDEHRNHGVGAGLMDAVKAAAADERLDYLMVHPSERSFDFYRRHGFADANGTLELNIAVRR